MTAAQNGPAATSSVKTAVPELSGGTHFPCLDAYRGIGMTMVLMNHAAYATGWILQPESVGFGLFGAVIARFDLSVPMFFVMSGFLLYRPFAKAVFEGRAPLAMRTFYRRRALRIIPAYWFALVALTLLVGLSIPSVKAWIANALFLPAFGVSVNVCDEGGACHVAYGITQAWSIGVEVTYYLLLPIYAAIVARLCRGRSMRGQLGVLLGGLAMLYLISTAFRAYVVTANPSWAEQSLLWLPMFLDLFAIGMALAVLSAWVANGGGFPRPLAWLAAHINVCWLIALVLFLVVVQMKYPDRPFGLHSVDGSSDYLPRQFLYGLSSAIWLFPAMFGNQSVGRLRRVLSARPLVFLGAVSLSFYLWHLVIIDQLKGWTIPGCITQPDGALPWPRCYEVLKTQAAHPAPGNPLAGLETFKGNYLELAVAAWIFSFAVAAILFRLVEFPFLRLKDEPLRDLFRRSTGRSTRRSTHKHGKDEPGTP